MVGIIRDILRTHGINAEISYYGGIAIIFTSSITDTIAQELRTALNDCTVTVSKNGTQVKPINND